MAKWSREVGGDRDDWMRRVTETGVKPAGNADGRSKGAKLYTVRDLYKAGVGGDYEAERLRKTREEADKLAIQNARSRGELVSLEAVKRLGEKALVGLRNKILSMPLTDEEKDSCLRELLTLGSIDWSRE